MGNTSIYKCLKLCGCLLLVIENVGRDVDNLEHCSFLPINHELSFLNLDILTWFDVFLRFLLRIFFFFIQIVWSLYFPNKLVQQVPWSLYYVLYAVEILLLWFLIIRFLLSGKWGADFLWLSMEKVLLQKITYCLSVVFLNWFFMKYRLDQSLFWRLFWNWQF